MITWWNIWPGYFFCIVPWIFSALPEIAGKFNAGGYVRQTLANVYMILLPDEKSFQYRHYFMRSDSVGEYIAVIPMLIALTMLFMLIIYLLGSIAIALNNAVVSKTQTAVSAANKR